MGRPAFEATDSGRRPSWYRLALLVGALTLGVGVTAWAQDPDPPDAVADTQPASAP